MSPHTPFGEAFAFSKMILKQYHTPYYILCGAHLLPREIAISAQDDLLPANLINAVQHKLVIYLRQHNQPHCRLIAYLEDYSVASSLYKGAHAYALRHKLYHVSFFEQSLKFWD